MTTARARQHPGVGTDPYRVSRKRPAHDEAIARSMLEHSLRSVLPAVLEALALVIFASVLLLRAGVPPVQLGTWAAAVVLNLVVYSVTLSRVTSRLAAGAPSAGPARALIAVQVIAGTCWGAGGFLSVHGDASVPTVLMAAVLMIATGNLIYSAATPGPFLALHLPLCILAVAGLAAGGALVPALLVSVIGLGALPLATELHRTVLGAVRLARTNLLLAEEVRAQQQELQRINLDLTEANIELSHRASRDPLTGLANRVLFDEHLAETLPRARGEHRVVSVLYFDLDRFKQINDTYGHAVGDALLKAVGRRVSLQLGDGDLLARRGGDEFTAVCVVGDGGESVALGERVLACFADPFELAGRVLRVTASVGVAADSGDTSPDELVARADAALYRAKELGRNRVQAHAA